MDDKKKEATVGQISTLFLLCALTTGWFVQLRNFEEHKGILILFISLGIVSIIFSFILFNKLNKRDTDTDEETGKKGFLKEIFKKNSQYLKILSSVLSGYTFWSAFYFVGIIPPPFESSTNIIINAIVFVPCCYFGFLFMRARLGVISIGKRGVARFGTACISGLPVCVAFVSLTATFLFGFEQNVGNILNTVENIASDNNSYIGDYNLNFIASAYAYILKSVTWIAFPAISILQMKIFYFLFFGIPAFTGLASGIGIDTTYAENEIKAQAENQDETILYQDEAGNFTDKNGKPVNSIGNPIDLSEEPEIPKEINPEKETEGKILPFKKSEQNNNKNKEWFITVVDPDNGKKTPSILVKEKKKYYVRGDDDQLTSVKLKEKKGKEKIIYNKRPFEIIEKEELSDSNLNKKVAFA